MKRLIRHIFGFFYVRIMCILIAFNSDPYYILETKDKEHWRPLIVNVARFKVWVLDFFK